MTHRIKISNELLPIKKLIAVVSIVIGLAVGCEYIDNDSGDYTVMYMFTGNTANTDISFLDNTRNTVYPNDQSLPYQSPVYTFGSLCDMAIATIDNFTASGTVKATIVINNRQFYFGESETSSYIWGYCNPFECMQ